MSLKTNTVWNLLGSGLPLLLAAVAIPFIIRHAGVEAFGILTMIWALIGYFSLFDFGLGRALTQQVAKQLSLHRYEEMPGLVKSGLLFTLATGLLGACVLAGMAWVLATELLKISVSLQQQAYTSLLLAALGIPLTTLATGLRGVLEAYEDFKSVNIFRIFLGMANFGLPAATVYFIGPSLIWMVLSLIVARFLTVLAYAWLVHSKLPVGWVRKGKIDRKTISLLLGFGAWMTVSNIISPLMVTADRFVISGIIGAALVAYYSVPSEMIQRVLILPAAITTALFPRLAALLHTDLDEAKNVYRKAMKIIVAVVFPICFLIAIGSRWGLELWLGEEFADNAWKIVVILSIGIFFNSLASIPFACIQASGEVRTTALIHLGEIALYLLILAILVANYGLIGAAVAWSLRATLDFLLLSRAVKI